MGVFIGHQVSRWRWLGRRTTSRASGDVGFHCLCIVGPWLAAKDGYLDSTCEDLLRKSVVKSVELLKCMTVDPWIQGSSILALEANRHWITLERPCWGSPTDQWRGRATWGAGRRHMASVDVAMWALGPLPHPLASHVYILHHFC